MKVQRNGQPRHPSRSSHPPRSRHVASRKRRRAKGRRAAAARKVRRVKSRKRGFYARELLHAIRRFLPARGLPLCLPGSKVCWTPRLLVVCAILMFLGKAQSLNERFADARVATVAMYSSRRRPGKTCEGFLAALARASTRRLLALVCMKLRQSVREIAGAAHWNIAGWTCFAVDGTKVECPMTAANEKAFGCAGKEHSTPQQLLTVLLHLGTGLPWAWQRGPGIGSERGQLRQMLGLLPAGAMLVADAGFTGFDLLRQILARGHSFVVRVGSNVRLLEKLGYAVEKQGAGIVYLWPEGQQNQRAPLVLRLETFRDGRKQVQLLTNVLDKAELPRQAMREMYRRRWKIELYYRSLKQTMHKRKMLSDSPRHAAVELDWCVASLWIMGLMTVAALVESGKAPGRASVAGAWKVVRKAVRECGKCCALGCLPRKLRAAMLDSYVRQSNKNARHWPRKKREQPPGPVKLRLAKAGEIARAREWRLAA